MKTEAERAAALADMIRDLKRENVRLERDRARLVEALVSLERLYHDGEALMEMANDCVIHGEDGCHCSVCGMELDTGKEHRSTCIASRVVDMSPNLLNAAAVLDANAALLKEMEAAR